MTNILVRRFIVFLVIVLLSFAFVVPRSDNAHAASLAASVASYNASRANCSSTVVDEFDPIYHQAYLFVKLLTNDCNGSYFAIAYAEPMFGSLCAKIDALYTPSSYSCVSGGADLTAQTGEIPGDISSVQFCVGASLSSLICQTDV